MYTLGDVHALRTAAQFLALLSLAVAVLLVARRRGMHNVQHSVDKLRRICCLAMVASAALFEAADTRNKQEDADLPQRTWRHFDSRTDFRRLFRFAASDVPRLIAVLGFDGDERAGRCRHQNYVFTADLAISVLLHTMTCDATLQDLNNMFGVKRSKASAVLGSNGLATFVPLFSGLTAALTETPEARAERHAHEERMEKIKQDAEVEKLRLLTSLFGSARGQ
jgi:hypothetical protein